MSNFKVDNLICNTINGKNIDEMFSNIFKMMTGSDEEKANAQALLEKSLNDKSISNSNSSLIDEVKADANNWLQLKPEESPNLGDGDYSISFDFKADNYQGSRKYPAFIATSTHWEQGAYSIRFCDTHNFEKKISLHAYPSQELHSNDLEINKLYQVEIKRIGETTYLIIDGETHDEKQLGEYSVNFADKGGLQIGHGFDGDNSIFEGTISNIKMIKL